MKVTLKYGDNIKDFEDLTTIIIGNSPICDFIIPEFSDNEVLKLVYAPKYNNYVLMNISQSRDILCNNKVFSKILVTPNFTISSPKLIGAIEAELGASAPGSASVHVQKTPISAVAVEPKKDLDIEQQRVAIIKEIGYNILELKNNIQSVGITGFFLNSAMGILSVVCSFGITNFLLGFKIDNSSSVLNLTTNFGFLVCITAIVIAICLILKQGVYSLLDFKNHKKFGDSDIAQKFIIGIASFFLFIVYVMNLFYYKSIPGFLGASLFISLLFVGALAIVTVGSGYFKYQAKNYKQQLTNCEFREDFESVMKNYRKFISGYVNQLTPNKINTVKSNLVNNQLKMVLETFVGILTSPFLAYGVSNTLASCFPEAANWVRISGLRFSPIFLVLATFLIIFAFFSFVRAFTIGKQIKGSEIIKFDGFHDYNSHGVTVLGLDSMRSLEREKRVVMFIACFIILIEFTMNVSYFITEIGGDIQGMFLSIVTALVPTALLIAETHMLSATMFKINNYSELLSTLD
ncbi:hypothetical protein IJ541_05765 [bacterium]|nr:hypothetical protein [bacterium]